MRYVTIADLSEIIRRNLWKVPHEIDLVVGVPRSGLLAANMIALYLNKMLTDIDSFINGRVFECGERGKHLSAKKVEKVLVVDDSVYSGRAMSEAKAKLINLHNQYDFVFASPIVTTEGINYVDIFFEIIDGERIFEWNLFHHSFLENSCLDIDGVLCCNPEEDDDGERYLAFINNARPLFTPTVTIDTLISCRLEKYRQQTEDWLKRNNISYKHLEMLNLPDKKSRLLWGKHGEFKGIHYKQSNCKLFIESSSHEALIIAETSNKPVICIETNELLYVPNKPKFASIIKKHLPHIYQLIQRSIKKHEC